MLVACLEKNSNYSKMAKLEQLYAALRPHEVIDVSRINLETGSGGHVINKQDAERKYEPTIGLGLTYRHPIRYHYSDHYIPRNWNPPIISFGYPAYITAIYLLFGHDGLLTYGRTIADAGDFLKDTLPEVPREHRPHTIATPIVQPTLRFGTMITPLPTIVPTPLPTTVPRPPVMTMPRIPSPRGTVIVPTVPVRTMPRIPSPRGTVPIPTVPVPTRGPIIIPPIPTVPRPTIPKR